MYEQESAVAAIRISSLKQGLQGDSPEAQKEQIERFAISRNIKIKKFFIFMESASKEEQPVQEAIDYCKNSKNNIQLFIIKSIDRFTRGGSYLYDHLKMQLERSNVKLVDIYGIIGHQDVNTLDHLGVTYDWSVYSPTKKSEILEAERAKDEMRDIMTRMIGAEIRYVRMGYRVRQAPFGYINEKIETQHGKRVILRSHPEESIWIKKMFELRCQGNMNDNEIVEELNNMGFRTRKQFRRNPEDRTKIIGESGNKKLHYRQLWRYLHKPVYAGVNCEKWTGEDGVKGNFEGLISIEMFNQANRGKYTIYKEGETFKFKKGEVPDYLAIKLMKNPKYPYKKVIMCPHCNKPLLASASRGKMGKYYPAYHCNNRNHYFRVSSGDLEKTVEDFVRNLKFDQNYINSLKKYVLSEWNNRMKTQIQDESIINQKIEELKTSIQLTMGKIKCLTSEIAIRYIEQDVVNTEAKINELENEKKKKIDTSNNINIETVINYVCYFLEHLEELLIDTLNPLKRAAFFSLIFDVMPNYSELTSGTPKLAPFLALKERFDNSLVSDGDPTGNRTPISRMRICRPNH